MKIVKKCLAVLVVIGILGLWTYLICVRQGALEGFIIIMLGFILSALIIWAIHVFSKWSD
jgi:tryptophan-rich sensory protein